MPIAAPSMSTSMYSGMFVASASSEIVEFSVTTSVSGPASPTMWIETLTVTFSPRRDGDEVDVLELPLIGSTCTCLVRPSWLLPSISSSSSALAPPCLSAIIVL